MNRAVKRASRNMIWGMANRITLIIFPFLIRTVVIYKLGELYAGLDSLFTSILQTLCLADLGIEASIVYSLYEPLARNDLDKVGGILSFYKKVFWWMGAAIFALGLLLLPFLDVLVKGERPEGINIYIVYFLQLLDVVIGYWFSGYKNALLIALQRVDIDAQIRFVKNVLRYMAQLLVLILWGNYYLYTIAYPVFTIVQNICRNYIVNRQYAVYFTGGEIEEAEKNKIKSKVKALFIYKIGDVVLRYSDNMVISIFLGLAVLGRYSNYFYVISALIGILAIYDNSIRPIIGNSLVKNGREKNLGLFCFLQKINFWIIGWSSICLLCLFQDFVTLWVGKNLLLDFSMVIFFAVYFYCWKIQDTVLVFKEAAGLWDRDKLRPVCSSLFNLIMNILLVHYIGLYGIVLSTILAVTVIDLPWSAHVFFGEFGRGQEKWYYLDIAKYTVLTVIAGSITFLFSRGIRMEPSLGGFLLKVLICVLVPNILYACFLWLDTKRFRKEKRNALR